MDCHGAKARFPTGSLTLENPPECIDNLARIWEQPAD